MVCDDSYSHSSRYSSIDNRTIRFDSTRSLEIIALSPVEWTYLCFINYFELYSWILCVFLCNRGWLSTIGFLILNTLWIWTTLKGYVSIKKKQIIPHKHWMVRSFFLSLANLTIYISVTMIHHGVNLSYVTSYTIAVWLCWILNLCLAEIFIRRKIFD